ncbi:MAG: ribonuclease D, partial [Alphaproteobacteria bacterium]|nr:ribonuclease D [Alphaproteobacteria bacterium]
LDKEQQCSDWTHKNLSEEQIRYAANDVMYLHALKAILDKELKKKKRESLAAACFQFLNTRAELDILGYEEPDLFSHH